MISGKEEEGAKFKDYFDWTEPAASAPSHRILAMRRGEEEGFLFTRLTPPEDQAVALLESMFVKTPPLRDRKSVPLSKTATSGCSDSRWRARRVSILKNARTKKR